MFYRASYVHDVEDDKSGPHTSMGFIYRLTDHSRMDSAPAGTARSVPC